MGATSVISALWIVTIVAFVYLLRRHSQVIRESDAKFRTLLEHAPEAIVILDMDRGRFIEVNETAVNLFGRSREELAKLTPIDVSPPYQPDGTPSAEAAEKRIGEAARGGAPVFEWTHHDADGNLIPCEVRLVMLPERGRNVLRGSVVDITDRKLAEERQRALEDQLYQGRKLEAVGQLTGGVAHDFNNILTVAMGNLELIQTAADPDSEVAELAGEARDSLERAADLTSRLLAFSRRQPLRLESVDTRELGRNLSVMLNRTLEATIEIDLRMPDDLWRGLTDRVQLENAIINLAINARDAMPRGGKLIISLTNKVLTSEELEAWFDTAQASPEFIEVSVEDTGEGIDASILERVFEPFFTTKGVGKGSGLGLSTIYGFTKQAGGHVDIVSEPGKGTRVTLLIPRATQDISTEAVPGEAQGVVKGRRVLFVEDDDAVRKLGVTLIESLGHACLSVATAQEAIESLQSGEEFDLLFTDVVLPGGIDGVELARRTRQMLPELRILFCSGYSDEVVEALSEVAALGPLLAKPYSRSQLAAAINGD